MVYGYADPFAKRFTKLEGGVQLYVRMCIVQLRPLFRISGTAERTALNFGVWLRDP